MERKNRPTVVGLDFDGTCTLLREETAEVIAAYFADVALRAGITPQEFARLASLADAEITAHPHKFGWLNNGHLVAAAHVDGYVHTLAISEWVLVHARAFSSWHERDAFLQGLFKKHSANLRCVFKPGVSELFTTLKELRRERVESYIFTNSSTDKVRRNILELGGPALPNPHQWLVDRVHGNSMKWVINPRSRPAAHLGRHLPHPYLQIPGLLRPVHVRRVEYFNRLDTVRRQHNVPWKDVVVMGDILELDLLMPLAAGATVLLVDHERVPEYERRFVRRHRRAHLVAHPAELLGFLNR